MIKIYMTSDTTSQKITSIFVFSRFVSSWRSVILFKKRSVQ